MMIYVYSGNIIASSVENSIGSDLLSMLSEEAGNIGMSE